MGQMASFGTVTPSCDVPPSQQGLQSVKHSFKSDGLQTLPSFLCWRRSGRGEVGLYLLEFRAGRCYGMDEAEQNKYVLQLKDVFDSCDTTGTGYLDREELSDLCQKLHLEAQIPLLLQTLLGSNYHGRVNFEDFKEGFVAVLSTTFDLGNSEDESSYLDPATPEQVEPKYVRGAKRYGRRSIPEFLDSKVETTDDLEESLCFRTTKDELVTQSTSRSILKRSASLESVESLKSDEELEHHQESLQETFEAQGQLNRWNPDGFDSARRTSTPYSEATENHVQAIWDELGVGKNGYLSKEELATVCSNIGLKDLKDKEVDDLFRKLDKDGDGNVSRNEFLLGLFRHGSAASVPSTPCKQRHCLHQNFKANRCRTATPSLISNTVGLQLFSGLDDGTGYATPGQIISMWQEDGIKNSQEILKTLDFDVEQKVNLAHLTKALDNELLTSKNGIHQAAFSCYRNEINGLQRQIQQLYKEREKTKADLDRAERCNVELAREVDDQHATMELINETKIKALDQGYKEKIAAVKLEMGKEQEMIVQQVNTQRAELEHELDSLRSDEIHFQEKLKLAMKENSRLQKELVETVEKLTESEKLISRLQKDLDCMLKAKFGEWDHPNVEITGHEQRFTGIIMEYEQQCKRVKELRDQNDELQSKMELLQSQLHHRKQSTVGNKRVKNPICLGTDGGVTRCQSASDETSLESECANISIQTEMAMEQLRRQHQEEVQDLKIQLETKVNYYEREIELMKRNFEKERKYVEQSFKIEIGELEDQRVTREHEMERLQGVVNELRVQQQDAEVQQEETIADLLRRHETAKLNLQEEVRKGQEEKCKMEELKKDAELTKMFKAQSKSKLALQIQELETKFQWERTAQQQAFVKEKSELELRLSKEKLEMEKELKLQHQKELQQLRKATQDESNLKLSLLEADHVALTQKYQSEKTQLIQGYELKIEELTRQQSQEKSHWESHVQMTCNEARKEKLNLQEKMHEEQAKICKTFAIEREEMETKYKEQICSLSCEIESLKAQVKELRRVNDMEDLTHPDEKPTEDNPCLYQRIHIQSSTNEECFALLKKKEDEILGLKQQRDEMEIKLRCESEMISEENSSLKREMAKFHQEFRDLEGEVNEQRKQVEHLQDERERRRRESEELQKQNKQYVAEIAQLNSKNVQLSNQNSLFSAKVEANQQSIQMLSTRLAELSQQKEEVVSVTRQLQKTSSKLEKEHFQQQSIWEKEKELMQQELQATKKKLLDLDSLAKETSVLRAEKKSLDSQSMTMLQHLQEAKEKIKILELGLDQVHSNRDHLKLELQGKHQENLSLTKEIGSVTKSLQEAKNKFSQVRILETELESMKNEYQILQNKEVKLEADLMESQKQLLEAKTNLLLSQSQHLHEVQQLKEQIGNTVPKAQLTELQLKLTVEEQKVQQLQEQIAAQAKEANSLMFEQQEEYKRLLKQMEERMEEVEQKLKHVRMMLQDKVNQLKEQYAKNAKSDSILKDLYVENAQLMKALQITEQRQKGAERKNFLLDEKIAALNRVLRKIAPASLS
ncbi:ninein-like protein isoform X2 [Chiloscyllium plagiosum]|uniref:ninein-like protein isoform X2 n=1 Tax=Chiloscyllium plagiosum TaxID=36176 RepID=UPI001CB86C50|nr:ninein-like protein isoform X2 [Chiloscyllium plagiosum]